MVVNSVNGDLSGALYRELGDVLAGFAGMADNVGQSHGKFLFNIISISCYVRDRKPLLVYTV